MRFENNLKWSIQTVSVAYNIVHMEYMDLKSHFEEKNNYLD